jgi:hypothetical protein
MLTRVATGAAALGALLLVVVAAPAWASVPRDSSRPEPSASQQPAVTVAALPPALTLTPRSPKVEIPYELPPGAKQGPQDWYVIRLHVRVSADSASDGESLVSASTNDHASAQLNLKTGNGKITNSGYGLVDGRQEDHAKGNTLELRFANYLQLGGVRGGRNVLTLELEAFHGKPPLSVVFLEGSRIERTPVTPYELEIVGPGRAVVVPAGGTAEIPFRLSRSGTRPDTRASVRLDLVGAPLEAVDELTRSFEGVGDGRGGNFKIRAAKAGTYNLLIVAKSDYNAPAYPVRVVVTAPVQLLDAWGVPAAGSALLVAAAAILCYPHMRRRRA